MSANNLKAMLSRPPLAPIMLIVAVIIIIICLLVYGIYAAITLRIIDLLICICGLFFLIQYLLRHFRETLAFTEKCRKNGAESTKMLEFDGLLEQADAEYNSADSLKFRPSSGGISPQSFIQRQNAMTPSFVFIMSENTVLRYSDIKSLSFYRRSSNERLKAAGLDDSCTVLVLTTLSNCSYDFYICKGALAESPTEDIICRQIINITEQLTPDCEIDLSVKG